MTDVGLSGGINGTMIDGCKFVLLFLYQTIFPEFKAKALDIEFIFARQDWRPKENAVLSATKYGLVVSSSFSPFLSIRQPTPPSSRYPIPTQAAGKALVTSLGLRVSMCVGDHLIFGDSHTYIERTFDNVRWPAIKNQLIAWYICLKGDFEGLYTGLNSRFNLFEVLEFLLQELGDLGVYVQAFMENVVLMFSEQATSVVEVEANRALAHMKIRAIETSVAFYSLRHAELTEQSSVIPRDCTF
ncbi:hypothetical protein EVAR_54940_1 [Eumeta japonica]|uniref:Uncharacterized protein n=1 Tax=Eumeta variegata TaxID=151549 RepID=A0A4C1YAV9_EUMVA|nr:hypothetical protein EVAR_54940_1 [Eumeta japonica]